MVTNVQTFLKDGNFVSSDETYRFVQMPLNGITAAAGVLAEIGEPFIGLLVDAYEVTLIIEAEAFEEYQKRLMITAVADEPYRLVTFDGVLPLDLVGFMAVVSHALADAGISILAFAAYAHDHFLIRDTQLEEAMRILQALQQS